MALTLNVGNDLNVQGDMVGDSKTVTTTIGQAPAWRDTLVKEAAKLDLPQYQDTAVTSAIDEIAFTMQQAPVDEGKLGRLLNSLNAMAPDIIEVALTTMASPLAGLGLVAKKINDKIALERAKDKVEE